MTQRINLRSSVNRNFDRRTITANNVNDIWAVDIIDMTDRRNQEDKKDKFVKTQQLYVFACVDVFSRYSQAVKIASKSEEHIKKAIDHMFSKYGDKPNYIWSDMESGIISLTDWFNEIGIKLFHVNNSFKGPGTHSVSIVERFNRTFRWHVDAYVDTHKTNYSTAIKQIIDNWIDEYNDNIHRTLNRKPIDIFLGHDNVEDVRGEQIDRSNEHKDEPKTILKVGDEVYLQKPKEIIKSKRDKNYFTTPFHISKVLDTNPTTYQLKEWEDEGDRKTTFYAKQFYIPKVKK